MSFGWSGKPINHFQTRKYICISKLIIKSRKFTEIVKKSMVLASFIFEGTITVFYFLKFYFIMCGAFERKEIRFLRIEKKYCH